MSTGISHFSICSLPPVRTRLHNVLPYAHGPSPSCAHRAGFWGFEQAAAPPVRGFPGFAFRLRSRAAKSAKQEPPSEFIRLDVHAVKAGINLRSSRPLITPVRKQKSPPRPLELSLHSRPPSSHAGWRFAPPRPLKPLHLLPTPHHRAPWSRPYARMRRARAGFEHAARCSRSMPRLPPEGCKRKRRPNRRLGAASAAKDEPARQARAPRALLLLF